MEFVSRFPRSVGRALLVVALLVGIVGGAAAQNARPFVTKWSAKKKNEVIKVPIAGANYQLTWYEVGSTDKHTETVEQTTPQKPYTFTAPTPGDYVVEIGPAGVERIQMLNWDRTRKKGKELGSCKALTAVMQWGDVRWTSMAHAFHGCQNMTMEANAGRPDLSQVTSLEYMFCGCSKFDGAVGDWDVSNVTNLAHMFEDCHAFNQPLLGWKVSKVTDMTSLFAGCHSFNKPLGSWDVSQVTSMRWMFSYCENFDQPLEGWDVGKVTKMDGMFWGCHTFSQSLTNWRMNHVVSMLHMFRDCKSFDQPLGSWQFQHATSLGLSGSGISVENYSASLLGWATHTNVEESFILEAEGMVYTEGSLEARNKLIGEEKPAVTQWKIIGDRQLTLAFQRSNMLIYEGDEATLKVLLAEGLTQGTLTCESSNTSRVSVLRVDGQAVRIKGVGAGEAILKVKMAAAGSQPAMVATCKVLVKTIPVESVELNESSLRIKVGESKKLIATVKPDKASKKAVTWSADPAGIVSLGNDGTVIGFKAGKTTVVATTHNQKTASCAVTVVQDATDITLEPSSLTMAVGDTPVQLVATVLPADATDKSVKWTVEQTEGFISVNEEGFVTAIKAGEAKVTATTHNGLKATCTVKITQGVESVTVEPVALTMSVGDEPKQLTAIVLPKDATHREVTWSVEPEGIVSVDTEGKVTPIKGGKAKVTATVPNGKSASCAVTVVQEVTGLIVTPSSLTMQVGDEPKMLIVEVQPADATDRDAIWSVEPEGIVSVSGAGQVTPVRAGVAKVVATSKNGKRAECEVTVTQEVTGISVEPSTLTMRLGDAPVPLEAKVLPADATDKSVSWVTVPDGIVNVDLQGVVTALKIGKARVIATTHNGKSDECEVTVVSPSDASSLTAVEALPNVTVSPNPFGAMLMVHNAGEVLRYALIGTDGHTVAQGQHNGSELLIISTAHLPSGMYILQLHGRHGARSIKLVK